MIILNRTKSDILGVIASSLCMLHCTFTPLLFVAHTQIVSHEASAPFWWKTLDYVFLVISFFAIYWSTKTTSKQWMKSALWGMWMCLCFIILNEKLHWLPIPEYAIYIVSISLVALHLYNKKYCQCQNDQCCSMREKKTL